MSDRRRRAKSGLLFATAGLLLVGLVAGSGWLRSGPPQTVPPQPDSPASVATSIDVDAQAGTFAPEDDTDAGSTPPATAVQKAPDSPLVRLAAVGDVGTGDEHEWETAGFMAEAGASDPFDGLILLGDNVYPDGDPERLDATVFDPFAPILDAGASLLPVLGNHDVRDGNGPGQVSRLGMPHNWYSVAIGHVLFIGLDSNRVEDPAQLEWLEDTLAGTPHTTIIAAMHHPAYSAGKHGSTRDVQELWVPLFEQYGVDLVLAGHDHDYQRSIPIDGVTYFVSGGGARLRPAGTAEFSAYTASVRHFLDIQIWEDRIEVTAVSSEGAFDDVAIHTSTTGAPGS